MRLRVFLVWLLMLALPPQGFAAVSMLFCGPAGQAHHAPAAMEAASPMQAAHAHDHAAHHHGQAAVAADHGSASADAPASPAPDAAHACGLCAACCHAMAISGPPAGVGADMAPRAVLLEPLAALHSRPSPVPDKPPRA